MKKSLLKIVFAILLGFMLFFAALIFGFIDLVSQSTDKVKLDILYRNFNKQIKREKQITVREEKDFYGIWKDNSKDFENRYEAIIDENSITVYKWSDKSDWRTIYWVGDFHLDDIINNINGKATIESKNFTYISNRIDTAAKSSSKEFIYNGESGASLSFISQNNDDYIEIVLNRYEAVNDRLRVVKYQGKRVGGYDENTNKKVIINGYEVSYPSYFNHEEEETKKEFINDLLIPDGNIISEEGMENNRIVLSPNNEKAYAELYIGEYRNLYFDSVENFKKFVEYNSEMWNMKDNDIILIKEVDSEEMASIEMICSTKYTDEKGIVTYGMAFETDIFMKEKNMVLIIGTAYDYNDNSGYDYLEDYKKVIKSIT